MKPPRFPIKVRRGSITTLVYRLNRADGREVFTAAWHHGGVRKTKQFTELKEATAEATLRADQLAAGRVEGAEMSIAARDEYRAAKEAAAGVPLVAIIDEWAKSRGFAGPDMVKACQQWAERHGARAKSKVTVAAAIRDFMAAKKHDGVDVKAGYSRTLPNFESALGEQVLAEISPDAIALWLGKFKNPVSRNSHHKRVGTLFRWARKRGLLSLDVMTAPERVDHAREPRGEIGLVAPEQLRRAFALILEKKPEYIPALVLASLCGLRRAEVHGQLWEHIDLGRSLLRVSDAKPNTPAHRHVEICPAAVEWFMAYKEKSGPICTNLAVDRIRDICRTAGLDLADNGLRHSYISARVVILGNVAATALEAGNSPSIIHQHYRELMRKDEAADWFAVAPSAAAGAKIIKFKSA